MGTLTVASAPEISGFPKRLSSLSLDFACETPTYVVIRMRSAGSMQMETVPLVVSTTNRHFRLKMPRNVEFTTQDCEVAIDAYGKVLVTGRVTFSYRKTWESKINTMKFEPFQASNTANKAVPDVVAAHRAWRNELMR